jgi:hypothetical protein
MYLKVTCVLYVISLPHGKIQKFSKVDGKWLVNTVAQVLGKIIYFQPDTNIYFWE